jgi:mono/diheme cytochrome c family protein
MTRTNAFPARWASAPVLAGLVLATPALAQGSTDQIERGKYLVTMGDCAACHTAPGGKYLAGNYALNMPFGVIMTPNLTPDKGTGLGDYTYADFEKSFRQGYSKHVGYLYPAFPFAWYTKVSDEDTQAIWAYLQSIPPVNEKRQESQIPFPFSVRTALVTWRTAFFTEERFKPDPNASAEVNRGGYLVEGLGHCAMCHNENKIVGNSSFAGRFGGGVIDGWYAPNITPDGHQGIGAWTDEQVVTYLKTGTAPGDRPGVAAGPMRQTIMESLSKVKEEDLKAMVAYLRTIPAKQTYKAKDLAAFDAPGAPGASTYLTYCSSCHQPDGKGIEGAGDLWRSRRPKRPRADGGDRPADDRCRGEERHRLHPQFMGQQGAAGDGRQGLGRACRHQDDAGRHRPLRGDRAGQAQGRLRQGRRAGHAPGREAAGLRADARPAGSADQGGRYRGHG